nr:MAG: hypothetical protein 2 [Dicistroviridae sp.]
MSYNSSQESQSSLVKNLESAMVEDTVEITNLIDQDQSQQATLPFMANVEDDLIVPMEENRNHDIKDWLARRREIPVIDNIKEGGSEGEILLDLDFPKALLDIPSVMQKTDGFAFIRADVVVELLFTAPPQALGLFYLFYVPDVTALQKSARTVNLRQIMQFPGIQINISNVPNIEFKIPFISPVVAHHLITGEGRNGSFMLARITPSSGIVGLTCWAHFENIHIEYPTVNPNSASTFSRDEVRMIREARLAKRADLSLPKTKSTRSDTFQGKVNESQLMNKGILSGILSTGTQILGTASKLPVIGKYADMISPITNVLAGVAGAFGFSKPVNDKNAEKMKIHPAEAHLVAEGKFSSHQFGVQHDNKVVVHPGTFGSEMDEMNIEYISRKVNYHSSFTVTSGQVRRTRLATLSIRPVHNALNDLLPTYITHQQWLASMFQLWAGKMIFEFEAACNQFHNVKLRFAVLPGVFEAPQNLNLDDSNSQVISFGANTSHRVVCPEAMIQPWLLTQVGNSIIPTSNNSVGLLIVDVEVPLQVTNALVPPSFDMAVFVYMEDARFAIPDQRQKFFTLPPSLVRTAEKSFLELASSSSEDEKSEGDEFQGLTTTSTLDTQEVVQASSSGFVNTDAKGKDNYKLKEATTGEDVVSLRQLALSMTNPVRVSIEGGQTVRYDPFGLRYVGDGQAQTLTLDNLDFIMGAYAFRKGGMHVAVTTERRNTILACQQVSSFTAGSPNSRLLTTTSGPERRCIRQLPMYPYLEGVMYVKMPYYQRTHMVRNLAYSDNVDHASDQSPLYAAPNYLFITTQYVEEGTTRLQISRSFADDSSVGFLQGLLPVTMQVGGEQPYVTPE